MAAIALPAATRRRAARHHERDYRRQIGEGRASSDALRHFGSESEIVIFPDENYWNLNPRNIVAWNAALLEFMGRDLS